MGATKPTLNYVLTMKVWDVMKPPTHNVTITITAHPAVTKSPKT
jgi:hypothetical protein